MAVTVRRQNSEVNSQSCRAAVKFLHQLIRYFSGRRQDPQPEVPRSTGGLLHTAQELMVVKKRGVAVSLAFDRDK